MYSFNTSIHQKLKIEPDKRFKDMSSIDCVHTQWSLRSYIEQGIGFKSDVTCTQPVI